MAQPASRPTARELLGVKKAHIAFREALQPHVLPAIQEHLRGQLLRPVGEKPNLDEIREAAVIATFFAQEDPTEEEQREQKRGAATTVGLLLAEGPEGATCAQISQRLAEVVAEGLKAAWIQTHRGETDFSEEFSRMTFFGTERAFGRLARIWLKDNPVDEATGIPIRYACGLFQAIDIFLRARAALPADQALPPGGEELLAFANP